MAGGIESTGNQDRHEAMILQDRGAAGNRVHTLE